MKYRNPVFNHAGGVDVEAELPGIGWAPYTVEPGSALDAEIRAAGGIATYVAPPKQPAQLDPARFEFLLALTGFGDVWAGLEAAARSTGDMAQYAALKAERARRSFHQDRTLAVVAQFRAAAAKIAPDVDLSDDAIKQAWEQAEAWGGL